MYIVSHYVIKSLRHKDTSIRITNEEKISILYRNVPLRRPLMVLVESGLNNEQVSLIEKNACWN